MKKFDGNLWKWLLSNVVNRLLPENGPTGSQFLGGVYNPTTQTFKPGWIGSGSSMFVQSWYISGVDDQTPVSEAIEGEALTTIYNIAVRCMQYNVGVAHCCFADDNSFEFMAIPTIDIVNELPSKIYIGSYVGEFAYDEESQPVSVTFTNTSGGD